MHYPPYAFGVDGEMTIRTKDPEMQDVIGQATGLSAIDKLQVHQMYHDICNGE